MQTKTYKQWKSDNKLYALPGNEVHIWLVSLREHGKQIDYLNSTLSLDEQERARNFRFSKDRNNYIIARGILRYLLSSYLGRPPNAIEFGYGIWGKPCLLGSSSLHFSVSHSGNYALYAFTHQYELGIDIEHINNEFEIDNIATHIFSPTEETQWAALSPEEKVPAFFQLWTCKEAYLKAIGKGWLENKMEVDFDCKKFLIINLNSNNQQTISAYPYCFSCIQNYASALFVKGPSLNMIYREFSNS